jgi:hypothetical protein
MTKLAFSAVAGLLGLALPLAAQQAQRSDGLSPQPLNAGGVLESDSAFDQAEVVPGRPWRGFPSLALSNGELFSFPGSFGWMDPTPAPDFLPVVTPMEPRRVRAARVRPITTPESDSYAEMSQERGRPFEIHGEVDFLYGRSTGKYGGDFTRTYVVGEIGNDNFRLSVGGVFSDWDVRSPRPRR